MEVTDMKTYYLQVVRRAGTAILGAAVATTALTGCGGGLNRPHAAGATVIVVGDRANMPAPSLTDAAMTLISESVQSQDEIYLINVSGSPQSVGHLSTKSDCDSKSACARRWNALKAGIQNAIRKVPASAPQADLLSALSIAGRQLANVHGPKHILVIDSGLQTVGALPLQAEGVLDVDPATISQSLKANGTLPDLHGVDVLMTGLGSTYAPQQPIREPYRTRLVNLWKAVVTASAGNFTPKDDTQLPDIAPARGLPAVTTVTFKQKPPPPPTPCDYRLRADQIGFVANEPTFLDEPRTRQVLKPLAEQLTEKGTSVTLIGTTAVPETGPDSPGAVSKRRALAVRRVLIELGVPAGHIVRVEGVGTNFRGFRKDTDSQGRLIEALAIGNRLVIVNSTTCEKRSR
jgi:outer membrane protein OmpA-like peptidoglycan-associated protein